MSGTRTPVGIFCAKAGRPAPEVPHRATLALTLLSALVCSTFPFEVTVSQAPGKSLHRRLESCSKMPAKMPWAHKPCPEGGVGRYSPQSSTLNTRTFSAPTLHWDEPGWVGEIIMGGEGPEENPYHQGAPLSRDLEFGADGFLLREQEAIT